MKRALIALGYVCAASIGGCLGLAIGCGLSSLINAALEAARRI